MVVVVQEKMSAPEPKIKKYVGNNMSLNLVGTRRKKFLIVGNNCCVKIEENLSSIKVIGDNCTLRVVSGLGNVTYIGNNGSVLLDDGVEEELVTYVGNNGRVSSKNGTIQRHSSDSDVRNCESVKVTNLNGQCNVSISGARTRVSAKKFAKIASTISLPNIQIHLSAHGK